MAKKKACALLMNDMHIGKNSIVEFQMNWDEALSICYQHGVDEIIIGGDLWLSRSAQSLDVLLAVKHAISKAHSLGINLLIAEGNHDLVDQENIEGYSHIFDTFSNVEVVDDYVIRRYGVDVHLYVMSYFPENGSFINRYNEMLDAHYDPQQYNVLYIHEGINGAIQSANDKELPAELFKDFNAVLVGHYHDRCAIEGTNIEYIGSSRQHNFGEDEEKGYTLLYNDGTYEFIKNKVNTRYCTVDIEASDIDSDFYKELKEADSLYRIKVRVHCKSSAEASTVDKTKLLDAGVVKVEIVTNETVSSTEDKDVSAKFDKTGIQNEYQVFCEQKGISHKTGLSYLKRV